MIETDAIFVDTNILVYANKSDEGARHDIAKKIIERGTKGEITLCVSNQVLGELCRVLRHKIKEPVPFDEVNNIVEEIMGLDTWKKINYTTKTVSNAQRENPYLFIWDAVIAQTMKENGITKIYTENTKDFDKIKGIKAVNPFAK